MIYFVRHGSTPWNDNKDKDGNRDPRCQGRADIPLNQRGMLQAQITRDKLKGVKFDRVICSPLTRAKDTCKIITNGKPRAEYDERLLERDFGEYEGQPVSTFDNVAIWDLSEPIKYKRVETLTQLKDRVYSLIRELSKQPEKNVLLVAHVGVGCMLKLYFKGEPKDRNLLSFKIPNAQPIVFDFNKVKGEKKK